jgi:hypothetical protein
MAPRTRVKAYGSVAVVMVIGVLFRVVLGGFVGEIVALTLLSLGAGAILLLVFLEVGLSEDRERAEEEDKRRRRAALRHSPRTGSRPRRPS